MTTQVRTRPIDDPKDLLARLPGDRPHAWVRHGEGLVGWGVARRFDAGTGPHRFARAQAALSEWNAAALVHDEVRVPGTGPVAFAAFTFDQDVRGSSVTIPRVTVGRRDGVAWLTIVGEEEAAIPPDGVDLPPPVRVRYAGASVSEVRWLEAVDATAAAVRSGRLSKVVLARDLKVWAAQELDVRVIARRLAERFDDCWTFVADGFVGATPELLGRRMGSAVESTVLAGSAPRGRDDADDLYLGRALLESTKDRLEHALAVDSVVERLRDVAADVTADQSPWLLRLANVVHLASTVTASLHSPTSALEVAGLLHPTAAVCGTPTDAALAHIRSWEGLDRGRYSGPIGWMDAHGNGEFGIALRCAEVDGTRARLFAGAGIVGESLPEAELEETRLKLRAMQSALESTPP